MAEHRRSLIGNQLLCLLVLCVPQSTSHIIDYMYISRGCVCVRERERGEVVHIQCQHRLEPSLRMNHLIAELVRCIPMNYIL